MPNTGYSAAKETAEGLRKETNKELMVAEAKSALGIPENLPAMYAGDKGMGAENLADSLPLLKIHYANQSTGNTLVDGSEPHNGWFYHTKLHQEFQKVQCNVLFISQGYQGKRLNPAPGQKETQFTQIMAGILRQENLSPTPFLYFLKGLALAPMWDFGKRINALTRQMPMFALITEITVSQQKTDAGNKVFVPAFDLVLDGTSVKLVTDEGEYQFLKEIYNDMKERVDSIINTRSTDEVPLPSDADAAREVLGE